MARRKLIWHIGLADAPRAVLGANLLAHRAALADAGAHVVATPDEAAAATHELLRTHREAGLARVDVEGQWARICDRVWRTKGVSLLSTPDLCAADKDQLRFALDQLIGIEVHVVLTVDTFSEQLYGGWLAQLRSGRTTGWDKYVRRVASEQRDHRQAEEFWAGHDLEQILARWGWTFHAERLHVVAGDGVAVQWQAFLDLAGVEDQPAPVVPPHADPAGVAVLRRVNRQLEEPMTGSVHLLARADGERQAMPVVPTPALEPLAERWSAAIAAAGHDLCGSLDRLCERGETTDLPGARDQLGIAVDALADALGENARLRLQVADLEADRERLDRKRRKLKRRLAKAKQGIPHPA